MVTVGQRYRPEDYQAAEPMLFELNRHYRAGRIAWELAKTLKRQALAGDVDGARERLKKLVKREAQTHAETPEAVE